MSLLRETRYAWRALRKSPAFTVVVVLTLALGTGANSAIFSVVNAVLLRPFPFRDPGRLAVTWEIMPRPLDIPMFLSPPNYVDWRDRSRSFEQLAGFTSAEVLLAGDPEAVRLAATRVTGNLFTTLGVSPVMGRAFTADDDRPGAPRVAVISWRLWQNRFGSARDIVGRSVQIDGQATEVVGVMGRDFDFPPPIDLEGHTLPRSTQLWYPFAANMDDFGRSSHFMTVVGRLRADATLVSATSELGGIARDLAAQYPESNAGWSARVVSMSDVALGNVRPALLVLLTAVGLVLLIACVNVANLLLARATGRQKEYAVRAALGAGRPRLIRQALLESQLLALLGSVMGLVLAWLGTKALVRLAPGNIPRLDQTGIDPAVIGYAIALSVVTGLLFGLAPALRAFHPDLSQWLRQGGRSGSGDAQSRLRDGLVIAEVALSLVLLVGAGLLFRSFLAQRGIDPGFRAQHGLTMRVTLPRGTYAQPAQHFAAFRQLEEQVRQLPGVEAAGFSLDVPLATDYQGTELEVEGDPPAAEGTNHVNFSFITPGYFEAMGIPVVTGRGFEDGDVSGSEPVIVINEAAARLSFSGRDALAHRIVFGVPRRVVGVVGNVHLEALSSAAEPVMYLPYYQSPQTRALSLVLRTRTDPLALVDAVRTRVHAFDPAIPVDEVKLLDRVVAESLAEPRFSSLSLLVFSLVALLLAAVGIYGVISYATTLRTREIGLRTALGARPGDAMGLVLGHALRLAAGGLVAGLALALVLTRYLRTLLFGVHPADPWTLLGVSLFLLLIAAGAAALPAWRASRVDPMVALRME